MDTTLYNLEKICFGELINDDFIFYEHILAGDVIWTGPLIKLLLSGIEPLKQSQHD